MGVARHHPIGIALGLSQGDARHLDQRGADAGGEIAGSHAVDGGADVIAASCGVQPAAQLLAHRFDQVRLVVEIGFLARRVQFNRMGAVGLHREQRARQTQRGVVLKNALLAQHQQMRQVDLGEHLEIGEELPVQARKENVLQHLFGEGLLKAGTDFGFHIGPVAVRLKTVVSRRANSCVKSEFYGFKYKNDMI
ncbi:hypothetical protein D3C87_1319500 [compost metagenome]